MTLRLALAEQFVALTFANQVTVKIEGFLIGLGV